tara:strand:+ start:164 stop:946 length:783 start_codon:yes stop_codon:yes gene_type:complete
MRARKRFGQHFLHDAGVLQRIRSALGDLTNQCLLEIGPGRGALTEHLYVDELAHYTAVEIDRDLVPGLRSRFPKVDVLAQDILQADIADLLQSQSQPWRIIGNLPYNISTPLIIKLIELLDEQPQPVVDMVFMVQKEMADRLCAGPGTKDWGRLSVVVQLAAQIEVLFDVPPESFTPPPKVDSSVIRIRPVQHSQPNLDREILDRVLKLAFSARRKRLANGLKSLQLNWQELSVDPDKRPDQVTQPEFVCIVEWLASRKA